jgi:predicted hydrolase (HD superfamily)
MTRQEAWELLQKYLDNQALIKHCLAAEATMRALARYYGEDEDVWGITGLLHDADYQLSKGHPEKHGLLLFEKEKDIPDDIAHAIKAHNYEYTAVMPESKLDWAITCCDQLTGLIVACALVTPEKKLKNITNDFVMRRLKSPSFAKGADRKQIYLCEEKLGIPLIEFVTITLNAMTDISDELGL